MTVMKLTENMSPSNLVDTMFTSAVKSVWLIGGLLLARTFVGYTYHH